MARFSGDLGCKNESCGERQGVVVVDGCRRLRCSSCVLCWSGNTPVPAQCRLCPFPSATGGAVRRSPCLLPWGRGAGRGAISRTRPCLRPACRNQKGGQNPGFSPGEDLRADARTGLSDVTGIAVKNVGIRTEAPHRPLLAITRHPADVRRQQAAGKEVGQF